ncbi:conserved hypothetical protein [Frankia canadensis]|uniref:LytR/CpsA/Psr regulator C-terminal domain-containing protein n=1 Tax=Frankia canadensis TaxID=1836972 RepID=A0A2I2L2D1_9ACTN|nr:LytR C-terminal domain-containing protein [Frankia canadensis]SNQ52074.1 conserved hypothetical protein [Frankia canadensis]SOU59364.1 conserved hypothetical protein [Frankia canadensis]
MVHGTSTPGRRRAPARRSDRLRGLWAAAVAILAVLAGILLVNLVNGGSDPGRSGGPVAAPTRSPDAATLEPSRSATPSARPTSASPKPSPPASSAARPTDTPPPAPASAGGQPGPTAPVVVLNNSRITGLADVAARRVAAAGFPVERKGNYVSVYDVPVSTIFYDDTHEDAAKALQAAVPGIEKIVPRSQTRIVVPGALILVITRDFPADPEK